MSLIGDLTARIGNILTPSPRLNSPRGALLRQEAIRAQERNRALQSNVLADAENELVNQISRYDEQFAQDGFSPIGSFKTQDQYNQFKQDFDRTRIDPSNFLDVYGAENGIRILNTIGLSQALLGADSRFDENLSTYEFGGEFTPFVRKLVDAEGADGRFVSVPLNIDGVPAAEALQGQGADGAPAIGTTPDGQKIVSPDSVGKEFPVDNIVLNLKEGGLNSPFALIYNDFKNKIYRVPQAESFFESLGLQEPIEYFQEDTLKNIANILNSNLVTPPVGTEGGIQEGDGDSAIVPSVSNAVPVFGSVEEFKAQFREIRGDTRGYSPLPGTGLVSVAKEQIVIPKTIRDKFPTYIKDNNTPPLNFPQEQFDSMTEGEKADAIRYENLLQKESIEDVLKKGDTRINLPKNLDRVKNWYKSNKDGLKEAFKNNPALFDEFNADPYAFSVKYAAANQNELFGPGPAVAAVKKANLNTKLDTNTVNNILLAAENQDIVRFRQLLTDAIGNERLSESGQKTLVNLLETYNGDFRRVNKINRMSLVGDMAASLSLEDSARYMPYLMRFADSGQLSFEDDALSLQGRKTLLDEAKFQQENQNLSKVGDTIFKEKTELSDGYSEFVDGDLDNILDTLTKASGFLKTAYAGTNLRDIQEAESYASLALKGFIEKRGTAGYFRNLPLTSWLFRPVSRNATGTVPNIIAFDDRGNPIRNENDANSAVTFQILDSNNRPQGERISIAELRDGANSIGQAGVDTLLYLSLIRQKQGG